MNDVPWSWGYGTNGFTDHPLPVALDVLQGEGYTAVALTLGHPHLDPFAADWRAEAESLATDLRRRGLRVVVETGARYLLDPVRKHRPTLVDRNAEPRMVFLRRAIEIAAILGADCVSLWSGVLPDDVAIDAARVLLDERLLELCGFAAEAGVPLALEPEPGMVVETVADALAVRARIGHPAILGVTVDLGHCVVVEPGGVVAALRAARGVLRNVQADDMRARAHEHLPFGEGELDLDAALATLREIDYRGVVAVELPRHAHAAPALARSSMAALVAAAERSGAAVAAPPAAASAGGGNSVTGGQAGVVASSAPGMSSRGARSVTTGGSGSSGGATAPIEASPPPSPSAHHAPSAGIACSPAAAPSEDAATAGSAGGGDSVTGGPVEAVASSAAGISSLGAVPAAAASFAAPAAAGSAGGGDSVTGGPGEAVASSAPGISSRGVAPATSGGPGSGGGPAAPAASSAAPSPSAGHAPAPRVTHPWTARAVDAVRADAARAARLFAAAGREVGREPLSAEPFAPTADDAARAAIVAALAGSGADPAVVVALYRRGDDAERRGVLRGLDAIPDPTPVWRAVGLDLVVDALRANDTRLVAAALGSFAAAHLDDHAWRHGVLKCVFLGIPLSVVAELEARADDELAAMSARFAEERRAAGRTVPDDLTLLLARERA